VSRLYLPLAMSDAAAPPAWSGPGLLQTFFILPHGSQLPHETLEKWLDETYIPEIIGTGVVQSAWRFKAADSAYEKQHMILYKIPDLAQVKAGKLQEVPKTSDKFPNGGSVLDYSVALSIIFSFVELYPPTNRDEGWSAPTSRLRARRPLRALIAPSAQR
jgi:hypothetical protein